MLVIEAMQIEKGMNILDLGCGTGEATIEIVSSSLVIVYLIINGK